MVSHSKMLLVRKVGIYGVLDSSSMFLFCGMLLLDSSGRSYMSQRRVVINYQPMMMTSTL